MENDPEGGDCKPKATPVIDNANIISTEHWSMGIAPTTLCPQCLLTGVLLSETWAGSIEAALRWKWTWDQPESEHLDSESLFDNLIAWKHSVTVGLIAKTRSVLLDYLDHLSGWTHSLKGGPPLGPQWLLPGKQIHIHVHSPPVFSAVSFSLLTLPKEFRMALACRASGLHCPFSSQRCEGLREERLCTDLITKGIGLTWSTPRRAITLVAKNVSKNCHLVHWLL